jgi:hypothetical protein
MPATIEIQHEILTYSGIFDKAALHLWGNGAAITRGFYDALAPYNVTLRNFQIHTNAGPADPVMTITVGSAIVKFGFENIDVTFAGFSENELRAVPGFLDALTGWLKKSAPDFKFRSHSFQYYQHAFLKNTTVEQFLSGINAKKLELPGVDLGGGAIFNRSIPERFWTTQITLDRSVPFPGALFLGLNIKIGTGVIEYARAFEEGMSYYEATLKVLDLESPKVPGVKE